MSKYEKIYDKIQKAEKLMDEATNICSKLESDMEEAKDELEELRQSIREVANYIEADDTTQIFTCLGVDGKAEWNKEYIVFRLRDLNGECYKDENGKERA